MWNVGKCKGKMKRSHQDEGEWRPQDDVYASGIENNQSRLEQVRKLQKMYIQENKFDRMPICFNVLSKHWDSV